MQDYLKGLNESQRKAVEAMDGPVMVIAGAGSGKTRVLTYRIVHLLNNGVDAFNILALTFTNKAAREMKERISKIVNNTEAKNLWMGTFHSVFAKILRIEGHRLGYPNNFTIYDTDDAKSLIKSIVKEMGLDEKIYKPALVYNRISGAKNNLYSPEMYLANKDLMTQDHFSHKPELGNIYKRYQLRLFKSGAMDFDDLLFQTNILFRDHLDVLHKYQHMFKYVMVDEYQDTNYSQYLIVKKLAAAFENICVVGDDAQSIYAFRGATIENILNFKSDYDNVQIFKLEQNYRSTQNIVKAANSIIEKNKKQIKKDVWTSNDIGDKIDVYKAMSENEESMIIANDILEKHLSEQQDYNNFAILYRTNMQSRSLEESLRKRNIPYKIYGGLSFYKRKEIKDLLAYFRLAINPHDEEALKRVINYPTRGIGNTTLEKLIANANDNDCSIWDIIDNIEFYRQFFNSGTLGKLNAFADIIRGFISSLKTEDAFDLASRIAKSSTILKDLYADKTPEGVARYENIQELLNSVKEFSDNMAKEGKPALLENFMEDVALLTDADESGKEEGSKVSLMTVHAAKGLEFPYVFISGMEENLFPSQLSIESKEQLEEERRLFYVAVTRAEKKATLTYASSRYKWGNLIGCEPSRFIEEISPEYLNIIGVKEPVRRNTATNFEGERPAPTFKARTPYQAAPKKLVKLESRTTGGTDRSSENQNIQQGMQVSHEKFGRGKVLTLEGDFPNQKATVFFENVGQKQLLLKFAKLNILGM